MGLFDPFLAGLVDLAVLVFFGILERPGKKKALFRWRKTGLKWRIVEREIQKARETWPEKGPEDCYEGSDFPGSWKGPFYRAFLESKENIDLFWHD